MFRIHALTFSAIVMLSGSLLVTPEICGQAVFLPSFRNFTYRGAVSVPDGGQMVLGGVSSSSEGAISNGVPGLSNLPATGRAFGNRGIGRENGRGQLSVKADIIIMEEIEAQMLADAAARNPGFNQGRNQDVLRKAAFLSKHVGRRDGNAGARQSSSSWNKRR